RHFGMTVIATAGRQTSADWCTAMGATHTIDYRNGLREPMKGLGIEQVDAILLAQEPDAYWSDVCELVAPLGGIVTIVDARGPLDVNPLKPKSARFAWEFMFTRALFGVDMERQGGILRATARLVEEGVLQTTLSESLGPINAANLKEAHRRIESGKTIGKLVLAGWE
ncbi:MAG TPA: zinc-binding alcohol dehydrogenase family protein, partial [Alcanivorax sp.]|nr:zinc-binding alcohol dehydrogenase family protein [Alcanivorax sp.]